VPLSQEYGKGDISKPLSYGVIGIQTSWFLEGNGIAKIYDSGEAVFVDARSREDYEEGHIKGAVSLPVGQFHDFIEAFKAQ